MEIKGSWFLWIGVIVGGVYFLLQTGWYKVNREEILIATNILYIFWNCGGLITMGINYKGNYVTPHDPRSTHYWDLDTWVLTDAAREAYPKAQNGIFRITSIACYIIWIGMLLHRYFNQEFTIKIKRDEKN